MNETLGKLHFWPSFVFMNGIFMPMFIQGLAGLSRRMYDGGQQYAHASDVLQWNEFMTISAFLFRSLPNTICTKFNIITQWKAYRRAKSVEINHY